MLMAATKTLFGHDCVMGLKSSGDREAAGPGTLATVSKHSPAQL
jgi:hypothetical protein